MKERLIIIGASGHGKVVADIAVLCGYREIIFLDDNKAIKSCGKYPVKGKSDESEKIDGEIVVAIGDAGCRRRIQGRLAADRLATLVHPAAVIADGVEIGAGTVIMAGSVVNTGSRIGVGCIINTGSSVDHDCQIGDYCHIAVGAHLCGSVRVGDSTWIGAGAIVSNNLDICGDCLIGAGAVVVRDIKEAGTYIGVPAGKKDGRIHG